MKIIFSDQALPTFQHKSIFLAGPSPRRADENDWRPQALKTLEALGFDGTVFVPIPEHRFWGDAANGVVTADGFENQKSWNYSGQVEWEREARAMADTIVFWVPRTLDRTTEDLGMPGFTTNFEMGEDLSSGKVLYGRPSWALKCSYLDQRAKDTGLSVHDNLQGLLAQAVQVLGEGAERTGGESRVPLRVWNSKAFQEWYANLKAAGNRLDGAQVLSQVTVSRGFLFCFLLKVKIWVESEKRHKLNEFFVARPDTSSVVAVYQDVQEQGRPRIRVALVREFRSTVNNERGMVYEPPSGSTHKQGIPPEVNAQQELVEETGLLVEDVSRFKYVGCRQLAATFSVHRSHVYAVELTKAEFEQLQAEAASGLPRGEAASMEGSTGERTYVEIVSLEDLYKLPVDYSTIGMMVEGLRTLGVAY